MPINPFLALGLVLSGLIFAGLFIAALFDIRDRLREVAVNTAAQLDELRQQNYLKLMTNVLAHSNDTAARKKAESTLLIVFYKEMHRQASKRVNVNARLAAERRIAELEKTLE